MLNSIVFVLFDLDATLLDTLQDFGAALNRLFSDDQWPVDA
ncbi:hypothetical protein [Paraglaciecola sp.]